MDKKNEFKPYIPADRVTPEITVTSIIMGILLAVIFGAANAYLGLRVGMTVSASIPAAVIAMGVIRVLMKKNSILESNIVQTIGSAGESVAAGAIFTLPALFMWVGEGKEGFENPGFIEITLIALIGGLLGVFFMIPLRNALIVKEHGVLPYPEGTACAEVLLAGEKGGANASTVFAGMGFAAIFKFIVDGIKLIPSQINFSFNKVFKGYVAQIGTEIYPAYASVGFICGPRISSYMFAGSVLSWLVLIPAICLFGADAALFGKETVAEVLSESGIGGIYKGYIRYIGAGALAAGGVISLIKSLPLIIRTFRDSIKSMGKGGASDNLRTSKELNFKIVLAVIALLTVAIWLIPAVPVPFIGAVIIVVFGFFFATVSSRMVGIVGSSNNPVSGMAIATLLVSTLLLKITGENGANGMKAAIAIGAIICIIAAISGDTSQDLKTGYILGSTPKNQQIGEIIGVVASSLAIGGTLYLLNKAWPFGVSTELSAPQASIMKLIVEGVMASELPWALIFIGVFIAVVIEIAGLPVLPFAIGVYLPIQLNACIMIGGLLRLCIDKLSKNAEKKEKATTNGTLFCSGMIAGEGLMGILLAIPAIIIVGKDADGKNITVSQLMELNLGLPSFVTTLIGVAGIALIVLAILKFSVFKKEKGNK